MAQLYPFLFKLDGMTQAYIWGGEKLKSLVREYPVDEPLAEIWTVSDRPEDERVSVIANGPLAGTTLRQLMEEHADELLGDVPPVDGKFPLLVKLMNSAQRLSLQVHPPVEKAAELGGDPKTESWFFLEGTEPTAQLFAGLPRGVTREQFETTLRTDGDLEPLLYAIQPKPGDCLFLPSGRLHAMDAGSVFLEVQENSNTTYRVFDWNRVDKKTGQPRELHVEKALASIDFADVEPELQEPLPDTEGENTFDHLVDCPQFTLERWSITIEQNHEPTRSFELITALTPLTISSSAGDLPIPRLCTALVPASVPRFSVRGKDASYIRTYVSF
ncbi:class I mannose-6-phosphate isomerase [Candidatus Berkelbacteria bacterium]|nr:class I mannose-6-phosphate isomerase [Candidatus Berkelbacteria bacterium]